MRFMVQCIMILAPVCLISNAPAFDHATIDAGSLTQSLTSFELDVTCNADYRRITTDIVAASCLATGQWVTTTTEICMRQIYQNCPVGYYLLTILALKLLCIQHQRQIKTLSTTTGNQTIESSSDRNVIFHFTSINLPTLHSFRPGKGPATLVICLEACLEPML